MCFIFVVEKEIETHSWKFTLFPLCFARFKSHGKTHISAIDHLFSHFIWNLRVKKQFLKQWHKKCLWCEITLKCTIIKGNSCSPLGHTHDTLAFSSTLIYHPDNYKTHLCCQHIVTLSFHTSTLFRRWGTNSVGTTKIQTKEMSIIQ